MHVPVGVALMHDMGGVLGALRMVVQPDDRRHERLLGRPPSAGQRIGEDDPLALVDGEEAGIQMRLESAAALAHQGHEGAAGIQVHVQHLAFGRRRNPPLLEAGAIGPGAPDGRPRRLDEARHREVEFRIHGLDHLDCPLSLTAVTNCSSLSVRASQRARWADSQALDGGERPLLDRAGAHAAVLARPDQAAVLEEMDVLHEGRQRHVERLRQFADARGPLAQPPQHRPARGIGQGLEDAVELR